MINRGKIRVAARNNKKIPRGVALDKNGKPTTDAKKALEGVQLPIAGFIRRGLIGEILLQIHYFLSINLDILVFCFVVFLYSILLILLIKSVKYLETSKFDTLIFLSPGFFLYPIMNSEVIGRKEILLFVILGSFVFFEKYLKDKYLLLITLISILVISLTHTGLLFYSQYLVFLYFE